MPANLTPQYHEAERRFKAAKESGEKLEALEEMIRLLPKHKGTDHMLADLRRRRSALRKQIAKEKRKDRKGRSYRIPRQGGGQVVLLGHGNSGKSSLLVRLTNAEPEIAPFPFSTHEPVPGMMAYEDAKFQLIDTPPVTDDFMYPWMVEISRNADAALLVADLSTDDTFEGIQTVIRQLSSKKIELRPQIPEQEDISVRSLKTLLVGNKCDAPEAGDRLEFLLELLGNRYQAVSVSAKTGEGLNELRQTVFAFLDVIRVYTRTPGEKAHTGEPFVMPRGSTVLDLAREVHKDIAGNLKSARLWGEGVYDGQLVKRGHVLHDKDLLELLL